MIYFISMNLFTFLMGALDKWKAVHHRWRVPERVLMILSLVGGCFGMMIAMQVFHHKTRKLKFRFVYLFCLIWIVILGSICYNQ